MIMKTLHTLAAAALLALVSPLSEARAQNLYKKTLHPRSLIADNIAVNLGDILTILISESHKILNEDKVDRFNETQTRADVEEYTLSERTFKTNILPTFDVRQRRAMRGEAKQEKDSRVEARIAVIVVDVQPNGNLVVAGNRTVEVDDEIKTLRISGIVRPLDITTDNTIPSSDVADARVSITGEGGNTRMTTRGPIGALFQTLVWAAWPF
jgi:flagellar L-ring protein precursor FlgH